MYVMYADGLCPGDVLLKKSQYSSCKIIILATNIVAKNCDFQLNNSPLFFVRDVLKSAEQPAEGLRIVM